ncbi:hypothetical protein ACHAQA_004604 [Verticillium albo-atrum]
MASSHLPTYAKMAAAPSATEIELAIATSALNLGTACVKPTIEAISMVSVAEKLIRGIAEKIKVGIMNTFGKEDASVLDQFQTAVTSLGATQDFLDLEKAAVALQAKQQVMYKGLFANDKALATVVGNLLSSDQIDGLLENDLARAFSSLSVSSVASSSTSDQASVGLSPASAATPSSSSSAAGVAEAQQQRDRELQEQMEQQQIKQLMQLWFEQQTDRQIQKQGDQQLQKQFEEAARLEALQEMEMQIQQQFEEAARLEALQELENQQQQHQQQQQLEEELRLQADEAARLMAVQAEEELEAALLEDLRMMEESEDQGLHAQEQPQPQVEKSSFTFAVEAPGPKPVFFTGPADSAAAVSPSVPFVFVASAADKVPGSSPARPPSPMRTTFNFSVAAPGTPPVFFGGSQETAPDDKSPRAPLSSSSSASDDSPPNEEMRATTYENLLRRLEDILDPVDPAPKRFEWGGNPHGIDSLGDNPSTTWERGMRQFQVADWLGDCTSDLNEESDDDDCLYRVMAQFGHILLTEVLEPWKHRADGPHALPETIGKEVAQMLRPWARNLRQWKLARADIIRLFTMVGEFRGVLEDHVEDAQMEFREVDLHSIHKEYRVYTLEPGQLGFPVFPNMVRVEPDQEVVEAWGWYVASGK